MVINTIVYENEVWFFHICIPKFWNINLLKELITLIYQKQRMHLVQSQIGFSDSMVMNGNNVFHKSGTVFVGPTTLLPITIYCNFECDIVFLKTAIRHQSCFFFFNLRFLKKTTKTYLRFSKKKFTQWTAIICLPITNQRFNMNSAPNITF